MVDIVTALFTGRGHKDGITADLFTLSTKLFCEYDAANIKGIDASYENLSLPLGAPSGQSAGFACFISRGSSPGF